MTKLNILNICFTFLVTLFLTSCNGQVKNSSEKEQTKIIKTEKVGYTKLKKSHWAKDDDQISTSLKDSKGRLWFGTSAGGVYCYDGKLFRQYTTTDGLSHNSVYKHKFHTSIKTNSTQKKLISLNPKKIQ
jgi:hypothetical protein